MARRMEEIPFPPKWKQIWNTWDLRGFIILSLSLQTILIFLAPLRKRFKSNWITVILWSSYLLADWAADFAVGLISNSQGDPNGNKKSRTPVENEDILAFWAPFLLVHLGGPDTITAFAMEDNELWLRHLLGLMFQFAATIYVFVQSLPHNRLWIPTMLMFISGIIKYGERTRSLYLASADTFKDSLLTEADPGPNYATLMNEYYEKKNAKLPTRIEMVPEPDTATRSANKAKKGKLTELELVQYGYLFYKKFRGLLVDMIFSRKERNWSRDFFLRRNAKDAFRVVEVELNFIYEAIFTKLPVVYKLWGGIARLISLATLFSAIILFIMESKSNFSETDVTITYALLFGALVLDTSSLCMLFYSNWTIIFFQESPDLELDTSWKNNLKTKFLKLMTETKDGNRTCKLPKMRFLDRRWSEKVSTYNLIGYCLKPRNKNLEWAADKLGVTMFLDDIRYVKQESVTDELREFIFEELRSKSELADDLETAKEITSARGDWVLRVEEGGNKYLKYIANVDYDQSLIMWHIATELCYNMDKSPDSTDMKDPDESVSGGRSKSVESNRKFAKLLSDYMLYLLIMQPGMMSAVAGIGQIRFRDTCAEIKRFFSDKKGEIHVETDKDHKQKRACEVILEVPTEVKPATIKGNRSKSLLFDSCILAKDLIKVDEVKEEIWSIISKVWVELLCYAASHARANAKAAQVSRGGELITTVWLLMTHFGLGDQFQIDEGKTRAKLIVGK